MITLAALYLVGCLLSFWMLRVDHESEKELYTKGARVLSIILSLLSFLMILITLIAAWVHKIKLTGYWQRPIKPIAQDK